MVTVGLFHCKKKKSLSELQGVPDGTFRCDVCKFVQPFICICGTVIDAVDDLPPKAYTLCGGCAVWLGFGEPRFPQGLYFNFSEEQRHALPPIAVPFVKSKLRSLSPLEQEADNRASYEVGCDYTPASTVQSRLLLLSLVSQRP